MKTINRQLTNAVKCMGDSENSTATRPETAEKAELLKARFGSIEVFMNTFCPAVMVDVAEDPGRAYHGISPTLEVIRQAFGEDAVIDWLCTFVNDFIVYCGKGTLSSRQMIDVAQRISVKSHLRVTEFMLFFWKLGNAEFGNIYGSVNPLYIMDCFNKFIKQREKELDEYSATTTDEVSASSGCWPVLKPSEFYQIAKTGGCIDPEAAKIALQVLSDYDGECNG